MNWFLLLLWNLLCPGIDDDPEDPADPADPADPEDPADPADPEDPADPADPADPDDDPEDPPAPRETRAQKTIRETRERAQTAERDLATARAELEAARRPPQQTQPSQEQVLWQQEEETLRNPEATDWQRYAIQANRQARQAGATSREALMRAEDLHDKTAFAAYASTKPKLYAAYKDRVEAKLIELRKEGRNVNREGILKVMLGEDMLKGELKSAETKPRSAAPRAQPRSDVAASGGGRLTDAEKRAKRLENVRI